MFRILRFDLGYFEDIRNNDALCDRLKTAHQLLYLLFEYGHLHLQRNEFDGEHSLLAVGLEFVVLGPYLLCEFVGVHGVSFS